MVTENSDEIDPAKVYTISLSGEGLQLEREIGELAALQILNIAMGGSPLVVPAGLGSTRPGRSGGRGRNDDMSIGEYLSNSGAATYMDKIVAVGAYLHEYEGVDSFTRSDIQEQLKKAREPLPGNYARDFNSAIQARLIQEKSGGRFSLTRPGSERVEAGFSGPPPGRPQRRTTKKRTGKQAEPETTTT